MALSVVTAVCVCMCVCEREKERGGEFMIDFALIKLFLCCLFVCENKNLVLSSGGCFGTAEASKHYYLC